MTHAAMTVPLFRLLPHAYNTDRNTDPRYSLRATMLVDCIKVRLHTAINKADFVS